MHKRHTQKHHHRQREKQVVDQFGGVLCCAKERNTAIAQHTAERPCFSSEQAWIKRTFRELWRDHLGQQRHDNTLQGVQKGKQQRRAENILS